MSRHFFTFFSAALMLWLSASAASAQLSALARLDREGSAIVDARGGSVDVRLSLTQPVPWRVYTLSEPYRLVLDTSEVIWPGTLISDSAQISNVKAGPFQPGWSRLVLALEQPLLVREASMETDSEDGRALLRLRLEPTDAGTFERLAGPAASDVFIELPESTVPPAPRMREPGEPLHVMLDPGHGGLDPGAEAGDVREADLMLSFARELREVLLRTGGFEVTLTREADVFVPLEARVSMARAVGADVFLSLHADALAEESGSASGATIYILSDAASDQASQRLAERHDQADLLAGVDLSGQSDEIALVLMEMARRETEPRNALLADAMIEGIKGQVGRMNSRPLRRGGFSVLKAPDIPSVLIELGFLSSSRDRDRLLSSEFRAEMAEGIRDGLQTWARDDLIRAEQIRK